MKRRTANLICIQKLVSLSKKQEAPYRNGYATTTFSTILNIQYKNVLIQSDTFHSIYVFLGNIIKQKLEKIGLYPVYEYLQRVGALLVEGFSWIVEKLEETFPGYHVTIKKAIEPYVDLFIKTGKLICVASENVKEAMIEKYPIVLQNVSYRLFYIFQ